MKLFTSIASPAIALALALTFATPTRAAMPAEPTLHVTTLDGKTSTWPRREATG